MSPLLIPLTSFNVTISRWSPLYCFNVTWYMIHDYTTATQALPHGSQAAKGMENPGWWQETFHDEWYLTLSTNQPNGYLLKVIMLGMPWAYPHKENSHNYLWSDHGVGLLVLVLAITMNHKSAIRYRWEHQLWMDLLVVYGKSTYDS